MTQILSLILKHLPLITILLLFLFAILSVKQCNKWKDIANTPPVVITDTVRTVDTTYVAIVDTHIVTKPIPIYVQPTPPSKDSTACDSIRMYSETIKDSLVDITVNSTVHGTLDSQSISYNVKVPHIKETVTITNTIIDTIRVPNHGFYLGPSFMYTPKIDHPINIGASLLYVTKSKYAISGEYYPFPRHTIGASLKIKL